ncbi:DUF5753 domain-containing protein [Nonomuraea turcica]|uniref:DUF5753 domain-containing protein n=1 Tax=Nonomuraea sp. G32 TaxID=3067274 RepID=UPI00273C3207|nr:DUF5753 domain-containing protein [Nonomuraea sp. G32]MDP4505511.1 DUF5753 domain-containing protein [Nonomuraea sp. G32]
MKRGFDSYIGLEAEASGLRTYHPQVIPGLLQTEAYARAVITATALGSVDDEAMAEKLTVRLSRQQLLTRQPPFRVHAILDEAVLRRTVGSPATMAEQCRHLIQLRQSLPHVTVQVLPFTAGAHAALDGAFNILEFPVSTDPDIVYLEQAQSGLVLEDPHELSSYTARFQSLADLALSPDESRDLIATLSA